MFSYLKKWIQYRHLLNQAYTDATAGGYRVSAAEYRNMRRGARHEAGLR